MILYSLRSLFSLQGLQEKYNYNESIKRVPTRGNKHVLFSE
jgi:hypothetical protein